MLAICDATQTLNALQERRRAEMEELNRFRTTVYRPQRPSEHTLMKNAKRGADQRFYHVCVCVEQQRTLSQTKKQKPKRPTTAPAPASAPAVQPPESSATDEQLQKAIAELQKEHEMNVQVIKKLYEEKKQAEKRAAYLQTELQTRRSVDTSRPTSTTGKLLHSKDDIGVAYGRAANAPNHKTRPVRPASASRRRSHQFTIPRPFANMESDIQSRRQTALQRKEEVWRSLETLFVWENLS